MPGLCFYFEDYDRDVWSGRSIDLDAWVYAAAAAGDIDRFAVINRTSQSLRTPDERLQFDVYDALPDLQGELAILVCPWDCDGAVSLWDFDHAVDWYVFGPAEGWVTPPSGQRVMIPQAGSVATHAALLVTAVMLHRHEICGGG